MARGLSELQQSILVLALRNHRIIERAGRDEVDFTYAEAARAWERDELCDPLGQNRVSLRPDWRSPARRVALSKACSRLWERGLIVVYQGDRVSSWRGADLTPEGIAAAQKILANRVAGCDSVSQ